jgi:Tfp pilus assembly protein PilO
MLAISVGAFVLYVNPAYQELNALKVQKAEYDEALNNSKILQTIRGTLSDKYKSFNPNDLARLEKLLPDNVDNIKLILEIQRIASTYGMTLQNVKFDTDTVANQTANQAGFVTSGAALAAAPKKDYGTFDLEFSTSGSYGNFVNFLADLERSLRIVDVKSVTFTSTVAAGSDTYKYDFKITTYWFKS